MADIQKIVDIIIDVDGSEKIIETNNNIKKITDSTDNHTASLKSNRKGVLESGGAMGILGAATGGLAMDFKDAIEAVGDFGISLKGVKGALIATGIGLFAVLLLELIGNWDKWSKVIDGSADAIENLNGRMSVNNKLREESLRATTSAIAKEEELLRLLTAQGASIGVIIAKQNEISDLKRKQSILDINTYEQDLANIENLIAKDKEYKDLKNELFNLQNGQTTKSFQDLQNLITEKENEIALYESENELFTKRKDIEDKLASARINYNSAINDPKVRSAEEAKLAREKATTAEKEKQKKLQDELNKALSYIEKNLDTIEKTNNSLDEQYGIFRGLGQYFNEFKNLTTQQYSQSKLLYQVLSDIKKLTDNGVKNNLKEDSKNINNLVKKYNELKDEYEEVNIYLVEYLSNLNNKRKVDEESLQATNDHVNSIINLNIELESLQSKMYEYEKSLDGRNDNSNKYVEIEERINNTYQKRVDIITKVGDKRTEDLNNELEELKSRQKELSDYAEKQTEIYIEAYEKARKNTKRLDGETDEEFRTRLNKSLEALILNAYLSQVAQQDIGTQISKKEIELAQSTADTELTIKSETANKEIDIEINTLERKREIRDEELQRQKRYYDNVLNLADEASNYLNTLASKGNKDSEEFAEAALKIQKASGIAKVAISVQEEVRGIWANPALTALPGTGIAKKTALTIGAVARGGFSIAAILSQNLNGKSSNSNGGGGSNSTGSAPQAQFDIVGSSATNQLANRIGQNQNQPINAYVVGSDVTSQQELDRNKIVNATVL